VSLLEEKIIYENMEYEPNLHKEFNLNNQDKKERMKELIFYKMIELINQSRSYMLGPEKTATARFVSKNSMDVYLMLKKLLKKVRSEN